MNRNRYLLKQSFYVALILSVFIIISIRTSFAAPDPEPENGHGSPQIAGPGIETTRASTLEDDNASPILICLSPGHPSYEGDKYYEAILNRKVAWMLKYRLELAGYHVILAVEDINPIDLFFSDTGNEDDAHWSKLSVMSPEEKAIRCNEAGANYLVSIHHNFAYDTTQNETMVFYTLDENYRPVHSEARQWAQGTARHLEDAMETDDAYAIADLERLGFALSILATAEMPGILTEASFYSNPEERSRLNDDFYLAREAQAIFNAFVDHLE